MTARALLHDGSYLPRLVLASFGKATNIPSGHLRQRKFSSRIQRSMESDDDEGVSEAIRDARIA
jgi:hypothetical protein